MLTKRRRYLMTLTGVIPAIAITAGLLSLPPESATRQQYWPWLPLLVLSLGLAFSSLFWLFFARRSERKGGDKPE
jgi:H+/Cl- antiporter ClcA